MTTPEALLQLQLTDSAIDLIRHQMPRLPEVVAANEARAAVVAWEQQAKALHVRIAGFEAAIEESEHASTDITKHRTRLEQQLRTVIAPREAEALMHEIELLNGKRSLLDDSELEALEGLSAAEEQRTEHESLEAGLRDAADVASAAGAVATAASEADLAAKIIERDSIRASLDAATVGRYDSMRAQHNGVAIAKLNGLRCEGCHLDLSRGEVDDIKRSPADDLPECPNCGRLLVR